MNQNDQSRQAFEQFRDQRNKALEQEGHKPGSEFHVTNAHYATWQAAQQALAVKDTPKQFQLTQDPLPEGWKATNAGPSDYLTDEANREKRVYVERIIPPFEAKDGSRSWSGPTLHEALGKAHKSLGIEYTAQLIESDILSEPVGKVATGFVSAHGDWRQELILSKKEFLPPGSLVYAKTTVLNETNAHPNPN